MFYCDLARDFSVFNFSLFDPKVVDHVVGVKLAGLPKGRHAKLTELGLVDGVGEYLKWGKEEKVALLVAGCFVYCLLSIVCVTVTCVSRVKAP